MYAFLNQTNSIKLLHNEPVVCGVIRLCKRNAEISRSRLYMWLCFAILAGEVA